jgi:hypothetical protein
MENKEKTSAEIAAERIANMPIHENYKPVDDLPIPLHKGVLVLKYTIQPRSARYYQQEVSNTR